LIRKKLGRRDLLERIDELLEVTYRSADLGNLDDPLAETVYILVSQQTREAVYSRVFTNLRDRFPTWLDCLRAPIDEVQAVLEPAGFHRRRAGQLRALLEAVELSNLERGIGPAANPPADLTLDFLKELSDADAERFLTSLAGIGPKSARCVLAYALDRSAFAVDTHVHRIFVRLGLVPSSGRKADHDPFQGAVPAAMRKRLHINLVHHGRAVCRTQRPRCGGCVLVSFCSRGREVAAAVSERRPVAIDLFSGAGGMGSGFREAGFRIALAVERDRHAAQTYRANNPGVPVIEAEINEKTKASSLRRYMPGVQRIDALLAGFPCQGYSTAGLRQPHDARNALYTHVVRLARQLKAQTIVLENVPGVRRVGGQGFIEPILKELRGIGYGVEAHLLRASDFGVPQHRLRYFFLGRHGTDPPPSPAPTHRSQRDAPPDGDQRPLTPRLDELLAELPELPIATKAERFVHNGNRFFNMTTMAHSQGVVRKIKAIGAGEGPISYRRLERDEARTLIAGHRALPVHPWLNRTISVREAAVIQGFPMAYCFCGPPSEQPLQVANAVPPPVARVVAEHMISACALTGARGPAPLDTTRN
jgi:DNA (cytosine-5)-methyltransferase 1